MSSPPILTAFYRFTFFFASLAWLWVVHLYCGTSVELQTSSTGFMYEHACYIKHFGADLHSSTRLWLYTMPLYFKRVRRQDIYCDLRIESRVQMSLYFPCLAFPEGIFSHCFDSLECNLMFYYKLFPNIQLY
jgi:hypothetical protein